MAIELTRFYAGCCCLSSSPPLGFGPTALWRAVWSTTCPCLYAEDSRSIRQYWLSDLLLSAVALIAYWPLADMPGKLFETSPFAKLEVDASL